MPTAIFGVACLGSLWTRRPLMFGMSVEFIGPDTAKGQMPGHAVASIAAPAY